MYSSGFHPFTLTGRGGGYTGRSEDGNSLEARRAFRWGMGLGLNRVEKQKNRSGVGAVFSLPGFGVE
jgi:hypothetical protein